MEFMGGNHTRRSFGTHLYQGNGVRVSGGSACPTSFFLRRSDGVPGIFGNLTMWTIVVGETNIYHWLLSYIKPDM